jgi:hypothetical protein
MFPLGFLFGLGFDTATEVAVFGLAAAQAAGGAAVGTVLVFPVLFAAGMSLVDTANGVVMLRAYDWAFIEPARKLRYNMTITLASAAWRRSASPATGSGSPAASGTRSAPSTVAPISSASPSWPCSWPRGRSPT